MSTLKIDAIIANTMPLPVVQGIGDMEEYIATVGQFQYTLSRFSSRHQIRVFVGAQEATWEWLNATTFKINTPSYMPAGAVVRAYKVISELAHMEATPAVLELLDCKTIPQMQTLLAEGPTLDHPTGGATINIDASENTIFKINLLLPSTTLNITFPPAAGDIRQIAIFIKQTTGAQDVVWDPRIKWAFDRPPILSQYGSNVDVVTVMRIENDILGFFVGSGYLL